jgi:hypothetical protein
MWTLDHVMPPLVDPRTMAPGRPSPKNEDSMVCPLAHLIHHSSRELFPSTVAVGMGQALLNCEHRI